MNLYEIDSKLNNLIESSFDEETGEILEGTDLASAIGSTKMELTKKIEACACFQKNLASDAEEIDKEIQNLTARKKSTERKAEWLKNYLSNYLQGIGKNKFETPKCKISFRKSQSLVVTNEEEVPKEFKKEKVTISIDKTMIKDYLKKNPSLTVNGTELVNNNNIQIK
jgi:hypothetical protein